MKKLIFFLAVLIALPVFQGCDSSDDGTPPDIPPVESMVMNLEALDNNTETTALSMQDYLKSTKVSDAEAVTKLNAGYAWATVAIWNTILTWTLAVPVASFVVAVDQNAEFIGDATWQWKYNFSALGGTYVARLTGEVKSEEVAWEMYISKEGVGAFEEFKWYEGTSALNGMSGQWVLFQDAVDPTALLQIDWSKSGSEVGSIKYKYVKTEQDNGSDDPAYGAYISYGLVDAEYDAFYQVHAYNKNKEIFQDTDIEINTDDLSGRIMGEHLFGNLDWHCWNSDKQDVDCSE